MDNGRVFETFKKSSENELISSTHPQKIALIIPYFGPLPPYFPIWLESAKANADVDFLLYTDQDVSIDAPNFRVTKTTLEELRKRFERAVNRPVCLPKPYKLCDYKPCYGLFFEEELRGYDFWGYCDIDLMFGRIRSFITDEVLAAHDRIYTMGHLSVYRNNEEMRRLFERPGSLFSKDEVFRSPNNLWFDESVGINRICLKNRVPWRISVDYADLNGSLQTRLQTMHRQKNYDVQAFYRLDGRTFWRYQDDDGVVKDREQVYIHWMKKNPVASRPAAPGEALVLTPRQFLICPPEALTPENMRLWNPVLSEAERKKFRAMRFRQKAAQFWKGDWNLKKAWVKQAWFRLVEEPYQPTSGRVDASSCNPRKIGVQ